MKISLLLLGAASFMSFAGMGCTRTWNVSSPANAGPTSTSTATFTSTPTGTITPPTSTPTPTVTATATPTATAMAGGYNYPQNPWIMFDGTMHFSIGQEQLWGYSASMTVITNFSDSTQKYNGENSLSFDVESYGANNWLNIDMTTPSGTATSFAAGNYKQVCFEVMGTNAANSYPMYVEINILNPGADQCNKFINITNSWQQVCETTCNQANVTQMIFMNFNNMSQKPPVKIYLAHIVAQ